MPIRKVAWGFICLALVAACGFFLALRSFQVFTQEELVATVRCEAAPRDSSYRFLLEYTPVMKGIPGGSQKFSMGGDQWSIGGEILKWHPWVNLLGLKNCHRITRLSSRYITAEAELHQPRSAYDLNGGTARVWLFLYRWGRWLPLVEAVYGNAAYTLAQSGSRWGVYVTLSGYLVKLLR